MHIKAQGLKLFQKDLKGLGHTGLRDIFTLDDGFVRLDTAYDIIGFNGQDLLQGISSTVSFQSPYLHLTETLAAELSFTAKRLLGNQRIRTGRTGMDLIIDQMMQFKVIHNADGNRACKLLAGTAVADTDLSVAADRYAGPFLLIILMIFQIIEEIVVDLAFIFGSEAVPACIDIIVCHLQHVLNIFGGRTVKDRSGDLDAQCFAGKAQMYFQYLSDIHTGRYTQRIQADVQRTAVGQEGHILYGKYAGNNTLVSVTSGHLITDGDLSLMGDVNTDGFVDAGRQLITVFT